MLVGVGARVVRRGRLGGQIACTAAGGGWKRLEGLCGGGRQERRPEETRRQSLVLQPMQQKRKEFCGREVQPRSPLLDHELMEFAARIPPGLKLRGLFDGKHILKRALEDVLPPGVLGRRKAGFGVPIESWLRGPLRAWTEDLLSEARLRRDGELDPAPITSEVMR